MPEEPPPPLKNARGARQNHGKLFFSSWIAEDRYTLFLQQLYRFRWIGKSPAQWSNATLDSGTLFCVAEEKLRVYKDFCNNTHFLMFLFSTMSFLDVEVNEVYFFLNLFNLW